MTRLRERWIVLGGLVAYWLLAASASPRLGVTADEAVHLVGGYSYWKFNDYRLHPENGNLAQRVAAVPLLGMDLSFAPPDDPDWVQSLAHRVGNTFLFRLGNDADAMLQRARAAIAVVGAAVVWLTWLWARRLYGPNAGYVALTLAVFSPTLLAHGGLATSDMVLTGCVLAALSSIWLLLHRLTWRRVVLAGTLCGAAFLAKMSGVIVAPLAAALLAARACRGAPLPVEWRGRTRWIRGRGRTFVAGAGALGSAAALSLIVLWSAYGFRYSAFNEEYSKASGFFFSWDAILEQEPLPTSRRTELEALLGPLRELSPSGMTRLIAVLRDNRLLPEAYLWGFAHTYRFSRERPAFLRGEHSKTGWRSFFPWAFWLKTSPALLALFAAGAGVLALQAGRNRRWLYRATPLLLFFIVYWAMAIEMTLNIGHRHILPTYPVVIVVAAAAALALREPRRGLMALFLAAAIAVHATESWRARPFYLAYFQPLAGGVQRGYEHLVDSSFDWGQGLPELKKWLASRRQAGDNRPVFLTYFGADDPGARSIQATRFADEIVDLDRRSFPAKLGGGWYIISATFFQRVYTPVRGPWRSEHEELYWRLHRKLADTTSEDLADPATRAQLVLEARDYEMLQFGRLSRHLHKREPDALIGASLLAFELTDAEVHEALYGPAPPP